MTLRTNSNKAPTVTATDVNSPTPNRNGPISSLVMYQSITEILGSQLRGLKDLDIAIFILWRFCSLLLNLKFKFLYCVFIVGGRVYRYLGWDIYI